MFEVKSTTSHFLGGQDFDMQIVEYLTSVFEKESLIDLKDHETALQRLKEASEDAKIQLSSEQQTEINLPFIIEMRWPRLFGQFFRFDEWSLCRG